MLVKRSYKRRVYKKKPTIVKTLVRKEMKNVVRANAEHKQFLGQIYPTVCDNAGTLSYSMLNDPSSGVPIARDNTVRGIIGQQIQPLSIVLKYTAQAGATDVFNVMRVIVAQTRAQEVVDPYHIIWSPNTTNSPLSPYDIDTIKNYKILYDKTFTLVETQGNGIQTHMVKLTKLNKVIFNGTTPPTVTKGDIQIFFFSDSGAAPFPKINAFWEVNYTDE